MWEMNKMRLSAANSFVLGIMVILIICLPYYLLGDKAFITIHDSLDLTVGHLNNITRSGLFFTFAEEVPLMDGVYRMAIPFTSPFELKNILYYVCPGYWGFLGGLLIVKICAFGGMFLLSHNYIIKNSLWQCVLVALLFSIIPFYTDYGLSSAGIPLLIYSLLNLYEKKRQKTSYLLVLLFALNSSLSLSGLFICFFLALIILYLYFKDNSINTHLLFALCLLSLVYVVTNFEIISGILNPSGMSNRVEMINHYTYNDLAMMAYMNLTTGFYHAGSFVAWPIIILFFTTFFLYKKTDHELFVYALSFIILALFIIIGVFSKLIPLQLFSAFQFNRFYFLYPSLCFILLAKTFDVLNQKNNRILLTFSIIISALIAVSANDLEYKDNFKRLVKGINYEQPSYSQFYDEKLFGIVANDLDIKQDYTTKVVSIGMYPSVAEYNGFYCLDGYLSSYSLDYKHQFRSIIEGELDNSESLRAYFDEWGNRCYVFSAELKDKGNQYLCSKKDDLTIEHLDINTKALKDLGCQYVFSAVDIKNYKELNLDFVNAYTTPDSYWNIRVYRVI